MLVKDVAKNSPLLEQSPLWVKRIHKLTPLDLQVFIRQHWGTEHYHQAIGEVNRLIDKSFASSIESLVDIPKIVYFKPPTGKITLGELRTWLLETTLVRRRAILFALETKMPISDVIDLTWKKFLRMKDISEYATRLAESNPRNLRLDYVFWEHQNKVIAAPLFGLEGSVIDVSQGMGFEVLCRLYDDLILVDEADDARSFFDEVVLLQTPNGLC